MGGRNDEECQGMSTPFLDDMHLFLLDQKAWISVKHTPFSQRLYNMGNHSAAVMCNAEDYEKTIIFGGITYSPLEGKGEPISHLSNEMYVIEVRTIV